MINYHLKSKQTNKSQSVDAYLTGYFKNSSDRLKISVGKTINPIDFGDAEANFKFDREKINKSKKHGVIIFKRALEDFETATSKTETYFIAMGYKPSKEDFKEHLLINLGRKVEIKEDDNRILLVDFIEQYCVERSLMSLKGQNPIKSNSLEKYRQVGTHVKNYQEHIKQEVYVDDFSFDMYMDFLEIINKIAIGKIVLKHNHIKSKSRLTNKLGYSLDTVNTITTKLRYILKQARIRGYNLHPTLFLDDERLVVGTGKGSRDFYFNEELLIKIYNHKPKSKVTQHAKDFIMIASTTGMRHQSVALIFEEKPIEIITPSGERFFAIKNQADKTGIKLLSPVMKPAMDVYRRLGKFPSYNSVTTITRQIRKLLVEMEIDDEVNLTKTIFGVGEVKETRKLNEVASSHVCRASFITNALNLRMDRDKVKMMTHKGLNDGSAFSLYDKRSEIDRAIQFYEASKVLDSVYFTYK